MIQPKVTAIIPYYNGGRFIRSAVESVAVQTLPPVELFVIDDGSPDGGPAQYLDGIDLPFPLHIERQENTGQSAARNLAARAARGDFLAFLDQDDRWYPRHIELMVRPFLRDPNIAFTYCNADEIDGNDRIVRRRVFDDLNPPHPRRMLADFLGIDIMIPPTVAMFRRSHFLEVGGFDERLCGYEDDDLELRLWLRYSSAYIPASLAAWRVWSGSTTHTRRRIESRKVFVSKLLAAFPDEPDVGRYYTRDYIAPRFFRDWFGTWVEAAKGKENTLAREAEAEMRKLARHMRIGRKMRLFLWMVHIVSPQFLWRFYNALPRPLRRRLYPG